MYAMVKILESRKLDCRKLGGRKLEVSSSKSTLNIISQLHFQSITLSYGTQLVFGFLNPNIASKILYCLS